jgi:hypothetical protein
MMPVPACHEFREYFAPALRKNTGSWKNQRRALLHRGLRPQRVGARMAPARAREADLSVVAIDEQSLMNLSL